MTQDTKDPQDPKQSETNKPDCPAPYVPPSATRATINYPARSKGSARGYFVNRLPGDNHPQQRIVHSGLERKVFLIFSARPDVLTIREQPKRITYTDAEGKSRQHTFDAIISFKSGGRLALVVKPFARTETVKFKTLAKALKEQLPLSVADELKVVTERDFTELELRHAKRLHYFRKMEDAGADIAAEQLLRRLRAPRSLGELSLELGLGANGFAALFRAISAGSARWPETELLSATTLISPMEHG